MKFDDNILDFADQLLESFFGAVNVAETPTKPSKKKPTPLDEINWNEPDIADVKSQCMSLSQVADFFNNELERYKIGGKADPNKPRIAKGLILGDKGKVDVLEYARLLSLPPDTIFDKGVKSVHSETEKVMTINTGIPAMRGLVWDKQNNEFRVVNTCPGAGSCATQCYALQGLYIFQNGKNIKLAQRLQLIFQDPEAYFTLAFREAELYAFEAKRDGKTLEIRWNDAGDFFSKRYLQLAAKITQALLNNGYDVKSYFYTKVKGMVELGKELGFTVNWSHGGKDTLEKAEKQSIIVPSDFLKDFIKKKRGRGFVKDPTGRTAVSDREGMKKAIVSKYANDPYYPDSNKITLDNTKFTDELPKNEGKPLEFNAVVLPGGDSDIPAQRNDVRFIFLIKH